MLKTKYISFIFIAIWFFSSVFKTEVNATHLVGGHIGYEFDQVLSNGNHRYKIKVEMYRDCASPPFVPFDPNIQIGIYRNTGSYPLDQVLTLSNPSESDVDPPSGNVECDFEPDVCIKKGVYTGTVVLAPSTNGYHLTHMRCCRNDLNNLIENMGQTYYTFIPPTFRFNSSPDFTDVPVPYICAGDIHTFNNTAFDPDQGDSIAYRLYVPFHGGSDQNPAPSPSSFLTLPLTNVTYSNGHSSTNPMGANGVASINEYTGILQLKAVNSGLYAIGIEVREYRNGTYLSSVYRDVQIIVIDCPPNDPPRIIEPGTPQNPTTYFEIEAGEKLEFDIKVAGYKEDLNLELSSYGNIFDGSGNVPQPYAQLPDKSGETPVTSTFSWQTVCEHARETPYVFTIEVKDDACPSRTLVQNFTIKVIPFKGAEEIIGPDTVCEFSENVNYTADGNTSSMFYWNINGGDINPTYFNWREITANFYDSETAKLSVLEKSKYGCIGDSAHKEITIIKYPEVDAGPDIEICPGVPALLGGLDTVEANVSYRWSPSTGLSIIDSFKSELTLNYWQITAPVYRLYKLQAQRWNCIAEDFVNVTVNPRPPKNNIVGDTIVCSASITAYSTAQNDDSSTFIWFVEGGSLLSGNLSNSISIQWDSVSDSGTIKMVQTNKHGCFGDTNILNIIISKNLIDSIQGTPVVCPNSSQIDYYVNYESGSTYYWEVLGGEIYSIIKPDNAIKVDWGEPGEGLVRVVETNQHGCISDTIEMLVIKSYNLQTSPISGPDNVCEFSDSIFYQVRFTNGSDYQWQIDGGIINNGQGEHRVETEWGEAGQGFLSVLETSYDPVNQKECIGDTIYYNLNINPIPQTEPIAGPERCCVGNVLTYSTNGFDSSWYQWEINDSVFFTGQGSKSIEVHWDRAGVFEITVLEISSDSCTNYPVTHLVEVFDIPVTGEITGTDKVCFPDNNSVFYEVDGHPNSNYKWNVKNGTPLNANDENNFVNIDWHQHGIGEISVIEVSADGCKGDSVFKEIKIDDLKLFIDVVTTEYEDDSNIEMKWSLLNDNYLKNKVSIDKSPAANNNWQFLDSFEAETSYFLDSVVITSELFYYYKIYTQNICKQKVEAVPHRSILLNAFKTDEANIFLDWNSYLDWENGVERYDVFRKKDNDNNYTFFKEAGLNTDLSAYTGIDGFSQCYRIVAYEANGNQLSWSNAVCLEFDAYIFIPNAFSPNDDSYNDIFKPVANNIKSYQIQIYNRWGERVFETDDIDTGWDGTYKDQEVTEGVYVFIIQYESINGQRTLNGSLTLIR